MTMTMTQTIMVSASASFSDKLVTQQQSTYWEGHPIKTIAPDLDAIEDIVDISTAVRAEILYREQGRSAFVSFEELKRSRE